MKLNLVDNLAPLAEPTLNHVRRDAVGEELAGARFWVVDKSPGRGRGAFLARSVGEDVHGWPPMDAAPAHGLLSQHEGEFSYDLREAGVEEKFEMFKKRSRINLRSGLVDL